MFLFEFFLFSNFLFGLLVILITESKSVNFVLCAFNKMNVKKKNHKFFTLTKQGGVNQGFFWGASIVFWGNRGKKSSLPSIKKGQ